MASFPKKKLCVHIVLIFTIIFHATNANNLDHLPVQLSHMNKDKESCNSVKHYFESMDIQIDPNTDNKGKICSGHCCSNETEVILKQKATENFERHIEHHTKSLRGILETTANSFRNHVTELINQSENATLHLFSLVYRRMLPQSKKLINNLYTTITRNIKSNGHHFHQSRIQENDDLNLETAVHTFFVDLFPIAYHQAILSKSDSIENHHGNHNKTNRDGDLHEDYIRCLKHTFDQLEPFGSVPVDLSKKLQKSVRAANEFINALVESAAVLADTNQLDSIYLTETCQTQLLKMSFCPGCNGLQRSNVKPCNSYCLNVMRGCLAQFGFAELDQPWSKVAEAIENLVATSVQTDDGILKTIKSLESQLSQAIMIAMQNGPQLGEKVKDKCGAASLIPLNNPTKDISVPKPPSNKPTTSDFTPELLSFLTTISNSKQFYTNIVNSVCSDEDIRATDVHCWTGDRVSDYTYATVNPGADAQKYNPEVPLAKDLFQQSTLLNELVDRLIKIRSNIGNSIPIHTRTYSDIQGDMAGHDEEGSGHGRDDVDDEEFGSNGSGDGSGEGIHTGSPTGSGETRENGESPSSAAIRINSTNSVVVLVLLLTIKVFLSH